MVSGEFAGPGMWKVWHDDNPSHVLWIVGDPPPLPRRMSWKSAQVEAVLRASQEILQDSAVGVVPDEKFGIFRKMSLVPAALGARKNPGKVKLKDLLPADVYSRWLVQKKLYLGHDAGVESWRPIFAANKLREAAFRKLDLRERGMVWDTVSKLARELEIKTTTPTKTFTFKADELRSKIRQFSRESLADTECFEVTLRLTESLADRELQADRARAWATADLQRLSELPPIPNPSIPCVMAMLSSTVAQEMIPTDIRAQVRGMWVDAAARSLQQNLSTFAIVPLRKLTDENEGYLAALRARGYIIEPPR